MRPQKHYPKTQDYGWLAQTTQVGLSEMPSTKSYRLLHNQVIARPGAAKRLAGRRVATLAEVGLFKLFRGLCHRSAADDKG